jgi:hypothetical protein
MGKNMNSEQLKNIFVLCLLKKRYVIEEIEKKN